MKRIFVCLIPFMLAFLPACQSSRIADLAARPGDKLFWDDFSDSSGNWPDASDPNGSLGIVNGAYQIRVFSTQYEVLATPGHSFRDVQIEADATRLAGPAQNILGLVCRSSNQYNYYFFAISSDGYYALGKIKNARTTLLGQEMMAYDPAILSGAGPNHLRFDCIGQTLKGYANGRLIAVSQDSDFSSGDVGLVAGVLDTPGMEAAFDNFVVYKP
jgi:hypothetical protein